MAIDDVSRRSLLQGLGIAGLPGIAFGFQAGGQVVHETSPESPEVITPKYKIKFAVIGVDHNHIFGITDTLKNGGGELVAVYSATETPDFVQFKKRFPEAKVVESEDVILNDPSIQLIASAAIPDQRAPIGMRAMRRGKDYLSDKPAITTLQQLAEVRHAIKETGRIFGIMYSERLETRVSVEASRLVKEGAIGRVIQTVTLAPHLTRPQTRPEWFWDPARYGGILCDIGSHQADDFVFYTGSTTAEVVASRVGNVNHHDHPKFQDFGDMMLQGNGGLGYVRVDWFTPAGLPTWGDGRLFILGTEGYMELRKYIDIDGRPGGNHLFVVDNKQVRYIDCKKVALPFGSEFVGDVVNRTHTAQNQEQALLATELVLKAQKNARPLFT